MRRKGIFSLVVYVIMVVLSAIFAIKCRIDLENLEQNAEGLEGLAGLGIAIIMILAMFVLAVSLVAMICKILHVTKGWSFFGGLCSLIDLAVIVLISYYTFVGSSTVDIVAAWPIFAFLGVMVVSFVSNIISLKR